MKLLIHSRLNVLVLYIIVLVTLISNFLLCLPPKQCILFFITLDSIKKLMKNNSSVVLVHTFSPMDIASFCMIKGFDKFGVIK